MHKVTIKDNSYEVSFANDTASVNGKNVSCDLVTVGNQTYHLLINHQSYLLELLSFDPNSKTMELKINGRPTSLVIQDKYDLLLEKLGMKKDSTQEANQVNAPMPGLILDITVSEGQKVDKGDPLLVLEAMKMENVIKSPGNGQVKSILVSKGDNVEKNQVLVRF